ncbi:MAG: 2-oxoglutarate dehydrogenase E1 component [Planctomycetes bacterium]|nr:2-oxoglutarate dehydrogenase E1 component [Planctomycetota bacterium]
MDLPQNSHSLTFVEQQYAMFLDDPESVSPQWRRYFRSLSGEDVGPEEPAENGNGNGHATLQLGPSFKPQSMFATRIPSVATPTPGSPAAKVSPIAKPRVLDHTGAALELLQERVDLLIRNYRVRGHMIAKVDPLDQPRQHWPELDPVSLGLSDSDMDHPFSTDATAGPKTQTLRQIVQRLRNTYCRSIGVQFMHITDTEVRKWLQYRMESTENRLTLSRAEQLRILKRLTDAVVFESFLATKYVGAKTFSLEGAETLIPLLDLAIEYGGEQGIDEFVIGMAHRGRLNVLANIMGKSPRVIFREFEDMDPHLYMGGGDVKYHLGHSNDWRTTNGHKVHLSLCFNPSHLEFIGCVAEGRVRAKQDRNNDTARKRGMTLLIHGDSAFAGEGVVQETLNLSQLEGYGVGGTLHIIVNNQVGFTTLPKQYRSNAYCTDIAKMLDIPIFHVNGEDPEAVAQVVRLGMDFRRKFKRDAVIDMYCYRRRGHNEGDEPEFTQPLMYKAINQRPSVREGYLNKLLKMGDVSREEADALANWRTAEFEKALAEARDTDYLPRPDERIGDWKNYVGGDESNVRDDSTGVDKTRLKDLLTRMTTLPENFHPHRKAARVMEARREMASGDKPLDWSTAELLAFATLATSQHRIRMTGQDSERGTFSQRHAVLHDVENGDRHSLFANLGESAAPIEIHNSPLSEAAVLGFEYGYSLDTPEGLIIWEAQFGDFVNVAQVIIDQFIASAEDKWRRLSGLTLLLPHGFEGQGPEHSSARMERFLMLAAEQNMQIVQPTTPAQYFHCLRRQVVRPWRKPLIVFTPKSLLRLPAATSSLDEMSSGVFKRVIADDVVEAGKVDRIVLCTGKIYYELVNRRKELGRDDVAIVRLEQLYPMPMQQLEEALAPYSDGTPTFWVQDEPANMGAWPYIFNRFGCDLLGRMPLSSITRPESASPATGSHSAHKLEQEQLMSNVFGGVPVGSCH